MTNAKKITGFIGHINHHIAKRNGLRELAIEETDTSELQIINELIEAHNESVPFEDYDAVAIHDTIDFKVTSGSTEYVFETWADALGNPDYTLFYKKEKATTPTH